MPTDIINLVAKSFIPGFLTALICCRTGSSSTVAVTMIPIASAKGVVHSLTTLLVVTIIITLLTYL
ncbi:MAG: ABC transporter permease, partial [Kiritimatiellae bacterium]|nr:ABC transporter permease [Kiritimatiellia bacterium]